MHFEPTAPINAIIKSQSDAGEMEKTRVTKPHTPLRSGS